MAEPVRFGVGERVAVYGWVGCRYRDAVVGTVIRFWVSGLGEWLYTVVFECPEQDGVCLVDASNDDLVRLAPAPEPTAKRPRKRRHTRGA